MNWWNAAKSQMKVTPTICTNLMSQRTNGDLSVVDLPVYRRAIPVRCKTDPTVFEYYRKTSKHKLSKEDRPVRTALLK